MKIKLQYPFSLIWSNGYIVVNSENRRNVILYNSHSDRSTISFARYLISVKLKRFLNSNEHVDHKDNDKTNDSLENLQILSLQDNNKKEGLRRGKTIVEMNCPICNKQFRKRKANTHIAIKYKKYDYCSKKCMYNSGNGKNNKYKQTSKIIEIKGV